MNYRVFAIFDEKARNFNAPFFMVHKGEALRAFGDLCLDERSKISKHKEDYKLYELGVFDDASGKLVSLDVPDFVCNATDFSSIVGDKK